MYSFAIRFFHWQKCTFTFTSLPDFEQLHLYWFTLRDLQKLSCAGGVGRMVYPLGMCLGSGVVEKAKHSGVPQLSGSGKERGPAKLMTQALLGGLAHTHTKRLYWAGYRETRICQPRLLARMKHSELSWLIIEFNPTLWGIKYIQSPPCYWHVGNSWRKCLQDCQIAENWEKQKHLCTLLPLMQGLKAVLTLDPDFASPKCVACRDKVTDPLCSAALCTAACHLWSSGSRKTHTARGAEVHTNLLPTLTWTL